MNWKFWETKRHEGVKPIQLSKLLPNLKYFHNTLDFWYFEMEIFLSLPWLQACVSKFVMFFLRMPKTYSSFQTIGCFQISRFICLKKFIFKRKNEPTVFCLRYILLGQLPGSENCWLWMAVVVASKLENVVNKECPVKTSSLKQRKLLRKNTTRFGFQCLSSFSDDKAPQTPPLFF